MTKHGQGVPTKETKPRGNVWSYAVGTEQDSDGTHPAIFPESLAKDHISSWSNPGDVVLDCFAGSGTTIKAAKELNRQAIGIEINPDYVQLIQTRLQQGALALGV